MKRTLLLLATLGMTGIAHADGSISGISVSKNPVTVGDMVTFTITGAGKCSVRISSDDGQTLYQNVKSGPFPLVTSNAVASKAGTFQISVAPMNDKVAGLNPDGDKCTGTAVMAGKLVVNPRPAPAMAPMGGITATSPVAAAGAAIASMPASCPTNFHNVPSLPPEEVKKGALRCAKWEVTCPSGWAGSMNQATGELVCVPADVPPCPPGWQGGLVQGKLICEPSMQPVIQCPQSTPDWKWGTTYYKENWKFLGCSPNPKPAN